MPEFIYLLCGLMTGLVLGYLIFRKKDGANGGQHDLLIAEARRFEAQWQQVVKENEKLESALSEVRHELLTTTARAASLEGNTEALKLQWEQRLKEQEEYRKQLKQEFENLANRIFEEKGKTFAEQNRNNLDLILNPLKEKITAFEKTVHDTYEKESKDRVSLFHEIKTLRELNQQISEEAGNLTKALKGDKKMQGNWGEMILEQLLERSGLIKDVHYTTQTTLKDQDGHVFRPDVLIHLPDEKHLVIDSKVSLVAYERYFNADTEEARQVALKEHITALKNHIRDLSAKNYSQLYGIDSPDFVMLFIPVEGAFSLAITSDTDLFGDAFDRKIVIVSTSTLLATLRTVSYIWRTEKQKLNVQELFAKAGDLYDKVVGFTEDMISLGAKLDQAKGTYTDAMRKFSEGTGNIIRRTEQLRELGASKSKDFNKALLERSQED